MPFIGIRLSDVRRLDTGLIAIGYRHRDYGSGRIVIDEESLKPVEREVVIAPDIPRSLMKPAGAFAGIRVKLAQDSGTSPSIDRKYVLRWEALEAHYDRPRKPPLPPASVLELVTLERTR